MAVIQRCLIASVALRAFNSPLHSEHAAKLKTKSLIKASRCRLANRS